MSVLEHGLIADSVNPEISNNQFVAVLPFSVLNSGIIHSVSELHLVEVGPCV